MIRVSTDKNDRIEQGDIINNIEIIEYFEEKDGEIELKLIKFPSVYVLTQDCDLEQDNNNRKKLDVDIKELDNEKELDHDKYLFSVLVAPLYNLDMVIQGTHLIDLGKNMGAFKGRDRRNHLSSNQHDRYHILDFYPSDIEHTKSVVDFKHYFTVNIEYLTKLKQNNFLCRVHELYREQISQRFANYLSRIGLPNLPNP